MEQYLDLMGAIVEKPEYNRDGGQEKIINQEKAKKVRQLELTWEQLVKKIAKDMEYRVRWEAVQFK